MVYARPETRTPGAERLLSDAGGVRFDPKGRPEWKTQKPIRHDRHFRNRAYRMKYNRGEVSFDEATHAVPVYRAFDIRAYRSLKRDAELRRSRERNQSLTRRIKRGLENATASDDTVPEQAEQPQADNPPTEQPQTADDPSPETVAAKVDEIGSIRKAAAALGITKDKAGRRYRKATQ